MAAAEVDQQSELDRLNGAGGIALTHAQVGSVRLSTSFMSPGREELRLMVQCRPDANGRLGIELSDQRVRHLTPGSPAARDGLLRVGDHVLSCDGIALGLSMTMGRALSKNTHQTNHVIIVRRSDAFAASLLANVSAMATSQCFVAQLLRVELVMPRSRARLGLGVNRQNGIEDLRPGITTVKIVTPQATCLGSLSVADSEGSLRAYDVIVELNGNPIGPARLFEGLNQVPVGAAFTLTILRLPRKCCKLIAEARARATNGLQNRPGVEIAATQAGHSRERSRKSKLEASFSDSAKQMLKEAQSPSGSTRPPLAITYASWQVYATALEFSGGNHAVVRLVMQKDRESLCALDRAATRIAAIGRARAQRLRFLKAWKSASKIQQKLRARIKYNEEKRIRAEVKAACLVQRRFRKHQTNKTLQERAEGHKLSAVNKLLTILDEQRQELDEERSVLSQTTTIKGSLGDLDQAAQESLRDGARSSLAQELGVTASAVEVTLEDGSIKIIAAVTVTNADRETVAQALTKMASDASHAAGVLGLPPEHVLSVSAPTPKTPHFDRSVIKSAVRKSSLHWDVLSNQDLADLPDLAMRPLSELTVTDLATAMLLEREAIRRDFLQRTGSNGLVTHSELFDVLLHQVQKLAMQAREAEDSTMTKHHVIKFLHAVWTPLEHAQNGIDWIAFRDKLFSLSIERLRLNARSASRASDPVKGGTVPGCSEARSSTGGLYRRGTHQAWARKDTVDSVTQADFQSQGAWEQPKDHEAAKLREKYALLRRRQLVWHVENRGVVRPRTKKQDGKKQDGKKQDGQEGASEEEADEDAEGPSEEDQGSQALKLWGRLASSQSFASFANKTFASARARGESMPGSERLSIDETYPDQVIEMQQNALEERVALELAIDCGPTREQANVSAHARNTLSRRLEHRSSFYDSKKGAQLMSDMGLLVEQLRPRVYDTNPKSREERYEKVLKTAHKLRQKLKSRKPGFEIMPRTPERKLSRSLFFGSKGSSGDNGDREGLHASVDFAIGARVEHPKRGHGTIVEHTEDAKARVNFDTGEELLQTMTELSKHYRIAALKHAVVTRKHSESSDSLDGSGLELDEPESE